ncbi:MAG TPA: SBBP repeat-containing protein [Terriglobia bacterium]|nr:SBBP repeat-containing protein [Terriglobia bacterium]
MGRFVFFFLLLLISLPAGAQSYSMPFRFEANQGQADPCVKYIARGGNYTAELNENEVVIHVGRESVRMRFAGGQSATAIEPIEELPARTNYYGGTRENWFTDIKNYRRVLYRNVYPNIDVAFRSEGPAMEFDFVAAAGADIEPIGLDFTGQKGLKITASGNLLIQTGSGDLQLHQPTVYQARDGRRSPVEGRFVKRGSRIGIEVGDYDTSTTLVIDPKMTYSTYAGGSGYEDPTDIAVDDAGNIYVVLGVHRAGDESGESFWVIKLARDGSPGYFTDLGTYFTSERGTAIAIDSSRNVYVTGFAYTWPPNGGHPQFPTLNPIQNGPGGGQDAVIAKLNPAGKVVFATFWGGSGNDTAEDVKLDNEGNIYITGQTSSPDFPTRNDCSAFSGKTDAYVTKISADLKTVIFSLFLGGDGEDIGRRLALDSSGGIYVAGNTTSRSFSGHPATLSSSTTHVFVTKLNPAATAVLSTWIQTDKSLIDFALDPTGARYLLYKSAGSGTPEYTLNEESADGTAGYAMSFQGVPNAVAVDADGSAYVTGTDSNDVFVEKITAVNHAGAVSQYHQRFNGTKTFENLPDSLGSSETGSAIAVDRPDRVYVAGTSTAYDFPTTNGTHRSPYNITSDRDPIIFVLEPDDPRDEDSSFVRHERGLKPATTLGGADRPGWDRHRPQLDQFPQLDEHRPRLDRHRPQL